MAEPVANEFNLVAVPSEGKARRRLALSQSNGAAGFAGGRRRDPRDARDEDEEFMEFYEMMQAVYLETQARMLEIFAIDDEASHLAVAEIDSRREQLDRERTVMIDRAAKREDGTAAFLTNDGTAIYTENGERLSDTAANRLLAEKRPELEAGDRWESVAANAKMKAELDRERAEIIEWDQKRSELRTKVKSGELSQEQLEELEKRYEAETPERVKNHRAEIELEPGTLSADELSAASNSSASPVLSGSFNSSADPELVVPADVASAPTLRSSMIATRRF